MLLPELSVGGKTTRSILLFAVFAALLLLLAAVPLLMGLDLGNTEETARHMRFCSLSV